MRRSGNSQSRRHISWRISLTVAALGMLIAAAGADASPAYALSAGNGTMVGKGFDTCQDPSESAMSAWWPNTPWWWVGLYIGGSSMACSQPNLSAQYLNDVHVQGWVFQFFWVGPQAPCTTYQNRFSSDPATAYNQGRNEAISAYLMTQNLGIDNFATNTVVTYDMEGTDGTCQAAMNSFVQGWVDQLHVAPAQSAGVYGSVCASSLQSYASGNPPPDYIFGAYYNGNPSTSNMICVDPGSWVFSQRLKQYVGGHDETWGGVTMNIDTDCANGPTSPTGGNHDSSCQ